MIKSNKHTEIKLCDQCAPEEEVIEVDGLDEYFRINQIENRILIIDKEITSAIYKNIVQKIYFYNQLDQNLPLEERQPIHIYINSSGGNVFDGLSVVNAIIISKTPIHTYAEGYAMSMAFMIFLAGHRRYSKMFTDHMYHDVLTGQEGNITELQRQLTNIQSVRKKCDDFIVSRTNIKLSKLNETRNKGTDWHFDSEEALKLGVCHEIITQLD